MSRVEEAELIEHIDASDPKPFRFQGWLGKRVTTSYGIGYDFDAARLELADAHAGLADARPRSRG